MMDDTHEIEGEEANTSNNDARRRRALADSMTNSMMESVKASNAKLRRGDPPTIYIVPQTIRQVNPVAYEPKIVSIGPYHYGKKRLQGMEENKWVCLHSLLSRNPNHQLEDYLKAMEELEDEARSCYKDNIGPYHNGKERLQGIDEHKWRYLHSFLSGYPDHRLDDYLKAIEELEDKARSCYSEKVGPQMGNEFVKMMVLDACFIVEIFYRLRTTGLEGLIFPTIGVLSLIVYDLLLLENQIPFFVLKRIFIMAFPKKKLRFLVETALYFFPQFMPGEKDIQFKKIEINDSRPYDHLLHLFHSHLIPPNSKEEPNLSCNPKIKLNLSCNPKIKLKLNLPCNPKIKPNLSCNPKIKLKLNLPCNPKIKPNLSCNPKIKLKLNLPCNPKIKPNLSCNPKIKSVLNKLKNLLIIFLPRSNKAQLPITKRQMIPCAVDLQLAGVELKKNELSNSILNVKFSQGVLKIPPLLIQDSSETLFRNLVAFEQCYPKANIHFTTYVMFMDFLVNTSKDVALLHRNGIIDNLLGSDDEVAHLFNRLCIGIFHDFGGSYLEDVKDRVQKHCENKRNMWRASLMRDYFSNPWSVISLIAASILLGLTITQTVFTILH